MAYGVRNRFADPATGYSYEWQINHSEEEEFGKARDVEYTAQTGTEFGTGKVGLVRQVGDSSPLQIKLGGTILHALQHAQFVNWFQLCKSQSIYFRDFTDTTYEVFIISFQPIRHRTMRNAADPTIPLHYWTYTMAMDVLRVLSGDWAAVTP